MERRKGFIEGMPNGALGLPRQRFSFTLAKVCVRLEKPEGFSMLTRVRLGELIFALVNQSSPRRTREWVNSKIALPMRSFTLEFFP